MEIRTAQTSDIENINCLYKILFQEMHALQPSSFQSAQQDAAFLNGIIASADADILVASEQGKFLGFALVQKQCTPLYGCLVPHTFAYLMDLAVIPEARSRGVGATLISAVRRWACKRRLDYVELNVLHENTRAFQLYAREGFAPVMHTMRCPSEKTAND